MGRPRSPSASDTAAVPRACYQGDAVARSFSRARVLAALGCMLAALAILPATAGAQSEPTRGGIDVVQVNGLLDPSNAALIRDTLHAAEQRHSTVVVYQLDGSGAIDVDVAPLVDEFTHASVPVAAWVGPSGGGAKGATALLALAAP